MNVLGQPKFSITSVILSFIHDRSIFRINDSNQTIQQVGNMSIISFYQGLLQAFPDTLAVSKKVKTFTVDQFFVIQFKSQHIATEISAAYTLRCLYPLEHVPDNITCADFMKISDPAEKQRLIEYEMNILASGKQLEVTTNVVTTIYIDPKVNKVVLYDLGYRVVSFKSSG